VLEFEEISNGYNRVFQQNELSIGLVVPIEHYPSSPMPAMTDHLQRVQEAEQLGFKSIWLRDIPFNVPSFGDAGQLFDPFTYLGFLAGHTSEIALGVASIALPLHHPVHLAKSAATIDHISGGRLILGVASGDRPNEYPSMGLPFEQRGEMFREAFDFIRLAQEDFPTYNSTHFGSMDGTIDVLPKPISKRIPLLITGHSQQSLEWNAKNGDGWMSYPKDLFSQNTTIAQWRKHIETSGEHNKPFMQPLYVELQRDDHSKAQPIPLGLRTGPNQLVDYLLKLREIGVNHVAINLRFNKLEMDKTLEVLSEIVLPNFHKT